MRVPNWIGDAVMCLPALEALKVMTPSASLTVLAKSKVIPVFENNPSVDGILGYEDDSRHKGLLGRVRLSGEVRAKRFDLAVLFQNAFDAAFIAFLSGIPERIGYARDLRSGLLTMPVKVTEEIKKVHQVFYYLNIIKELGGRAPDAPVPRIFISGSEDSRALAFLKEKGLEGVFLLGAAPGASYGPAKRWPPEAFAEALERATVELKAVPLIFGGPEDAPVCAEVSKRLKARHLDLSGKLKLRESMALMNRCSAFITNDSGPMHISAALGIPTVAIFGSTDPVLTGPLGPKVRVIKKDGVECSPCFERTCRYGHYNCLSITPEEVLEGVKGLNLK